MRYIITVECTISYGDAGGSDIRTFDRICNPDELNDQFSAWMTEWFSECSPDRYTTYTIQHAFIVQESLSSDLLDQCIANAAIKFNEEEKRKKDEAAALAREEKRQRDLAELARLKEQYPDA